MAVSRWDRTTVTPPDPAGADSFDDIAERLRSLKIWAGDPSYDTIKHRINAAWRQAGRPDSESARRATVADCFRAGRRRLNTDLVTAVVRSLYPDVGYVTQWQQALQVIRGEAGTRSSVRMQDSLPPDLVAFAGRDAEMTELRQALRRGGRDVAAAVIVGMAGVGKTQLAVRAGHLFAREKSVDRVLFVDLHAFHPGPPEAPADPTAVLDGFLRLLGVTGQQIPHTLSGRAAMYRARLAGTRTLVVLDNAATAGQVLPLLPATPGCPVLVTSRRTLDDLPAVARLTVDVLTPNEAAAFLTRAVPDVPVGDDPGAPARITRRCGHLPLALGLIAGRIGRTAGWTLTDHADRLDERHRDHRLETGVRLAIDQSYERLVADHRRLLRLTAMHPGQDFDAYAAAALADTDVRAAEDGLRHLHRDHLVRQPALGRYALPDLIRAYARGRAGDEDPPKARHSALNRLVDHHLAAATTATDSAAGDPHVVLGRPKAESRALAGVVP